MILNKKTLAQLSESMWLFLTQEQEQIILEHLGTEPSDEYEWSEQDIVEQIRHIIRDHPSPVTIPDLLK